MMIVLSFLAGVVATIAMGFLVKTEKWEELNKKNKE